jgi:cupin 2 domain-containing protein
VPNLFENLPVSTDAEDFAQLLSRPSVRIERIVSHGQSTPLDAPYDQRHDEWVLLLSGSASLWIDGDGTHDLRPGDYVLIPARCRRRVTRTAATEQTIWLAIHLG